MRKIVDLFKDKERTFSFELFPPKTEEGYQKLLSTIEALCRLKPDFISCTYGAGGGSRDKTIDIVEKIQNQFHTIGLAHLTCVLHTKEEIKKILADVKSRGINNVLALRGDPPKDNPNWQPGPTNFKYSSELCAFIRQEFDDYFGIGELVVRAPNRVERHEFGRRLEEVLPHAVPKVQVATKLNLLGAF